jgi:hypothetical protein
MKIMLSMLVLLSINARIHKNLALCVKLSLVIKVIHKVTLSLGLLESQLFCFVKFSFPV